MLDPFTEKRLVRLLETFKKNHGRDISMAELEKAGFSQSDVKNGVHSGLLKKYSATTQSGANENRFKLNKDWKSLNS